MTFFTLTETQNFESAFFSAPGDIWEETTGNYVTLQTNVTDL